MDQFGPEFTKFGPSPNRFGSKTDLRVAQHGMCLGFVVGTDVANRRLQSARQVSPTHVTCNFALPSGFAPVEQSLLCFRPNMRHCRRSRGLPCPLQCCGTCSISWPLGHCCHIEVVAKARDFRVLGTHSRIREVLDDVAALRSSQEPVVVWRAPRWFPGTPVHVLERRRRADGALPPALRNVGTLGIPEMRLRLRISRVPETSETVAVGSRQ